MCRPWGSVGVIRVRISTHVVRPVVCKHQACKVVYKCSGSVRGVDIIVTLDFNFLQYPVPTGGR